MDEKSIKALAGESDWYPEADKLLEPIHTKLKEYMPEIQAWFVLEDLFSGLVVADVRGHIHVADEHEWAYLAVRARELRMES